MNKDATVLRPQDVIIVECCLLKKKAKLFQYPRIFISRTGGRNMKYSYTKNYILLFSISLGKQFWEKYCE